MREQTDYVSASAVTISAMACDDHVAGLRAALYDRYGTYQCDAIGDSPVSPTSYPNDTSLMDTVNKLLDADSYFAEIEQQIIARKSTKDNHSTD